MHFIKVFECSLDKLTTFVEPYVTSLRTYDRIQTNFFQSGWIASRRSLNWSQSSGETDM